MLITIVMLGVSLIAQDAPAPAASPAEQLRQLNAEHEAGWQAFLKANNEAKTAEDLAALNTMPGKNPRGYADRFMSLARANPGTGVAEEALVWVGAHVMFGPETEEAKQLLIRDHSTSHRLAPVFAFQVLTVGSVATERLYRAVIASSPDRQVQALAHYWLGRFLTDQAEASRQLKRGSRIAVGSSPLVVAGWGEDYRDRLKRLDPQALDAEAEREFEQAARADPALPHNDKLRTPGTLATAAASHLRELRDLAVGKVAPSTAGEDLDGQRFRLEDYRGKVVVLNFSSHFSCGTCREMYPHERDLARRLATQPFALVTIDSSPNRADLTAAWKAEGNPWRCVWDQSWDGPLYSAWNIQVNPTIYVLDSAGVIRYKATNDPGPELDRVVAELLAEWEKAGNPSRPNPALEAHLPAR